MLAFSKWRAFWRQPQSIKHLLTMVLFPGVGYWSVLVWHLVLGAWLFCLAAMPFGFEGDFVGPWHMWQPFAVQACVIGAGFLVWGWNRGSRLLGRNRDYLPD